MKVSAVLLLLLCAISTYAAPKPQLNLTRASSTDFQCLAPQCDPYTNWGHLWPHSDPGCFYQCTHYGPVVHRCGPGTLFGFRAQVCVHTRDYVQALDNCP